MGTKQILYNALVSQLEIKRIEAEKYSNKIYNPAVKKLNANILNYFTDKVKGFKTITYVGKSIHLETENNRYNKVDIFMKNAETSQVMMEWGSGNINNKNNEGDDYLNLIINTKANLEEITDNFLNKWYPTHIKINNEYSEAWKEYNNLKIALDNLSYEIKNDNFEEMKQVGFEIKSFKKQKLLDYDYGKNGMSNYKIVTRTKSIEIQHGRSQYESKYIDGFKVLGKKGNKYNVVVYRGGSVDQTFSILEKKYNSFISKVNKWENIEADRENEKCIERYNNQTKNK